MKQCRTNKITVVGAVNKPGPHELPRGSSSLMAALVAAEGLTKEAGTEVEIRHTDSRQATAGGPQSPAPYSADGANGMVSPAAYEQVTADGRRTERHESEPLGSRRPAANKCPNFATATWFTSPNACCGRSM